MEVHDPELLHAETDTGKRIAICVGKKRNQSNTIGAMNLNVLIGKLPIGLHVIYIVKRKEWLDVSINQVIALKLLALN